MRYIPDLVHEEKKILKDYFKGESKAHYKMSKASSTFAYLGFFFLIITSIVFIKHPVLLTIIILLAIIVVPNGHYWIEKTFRFRFKLPIKLAVCIPMLIACFTLAFYYMSLDEKAELDHQLVLKEQERKRVEEEKIAQERKEKLIVYLDSAMMLSKAGHLDKALLVVDSAFIFAVDDENKKMLSEQRADILVIGAEKLIEKYQYKKAIPILDDVISAQYNNRNALYNRAICLSKIGNTKDAVRDVKKAMGLGHPDAEKLHEKINPLLKRITGYHTVCCDGSTSYSSGRGTCSHHGGVCGTAPDYEKYRKYE